MKIYFDESGQSGSHLLDINQPYFSLGSTNIGEEEAAEIIARCFPRYQGNEIKSSNVLRRSSGQKAFLEFAKIVGSRSDQFCATKISKRFTIVAKMVDNLIEPLQSAQGRDFYHNDYARNFTNAAYLVFDQLLDAASAQALMELYNSFARAPDKEKLTSLDKKLKTASKNAEGGSKIFLSMMRAGTSYLAKRDNLDSLEDSSEFHVSAAVQCMGYWQARDPGPFEVIHDESTHFFRRSEEWERITNPMLPPELIEVGDKTLRLPINVISTVSAHSHESASLQLCDLIAGFITRAFAPSPSQEFARFLEAAAANGMSELSIFPIDAREDVPDGPPPFAVGPDTIDRIALAVRRGAGRPLGKADNETN